MNAKRISELLFAALFVLLLSAAAAATLLLPKETESFYENRKLAALPEPEALYSGAYGKALERWYGDHAALREPLLKLRTAAELAWNKTRCPVVNQVVVLDDLLLPFLPYEELNAETIENRVERLADNLAGVRDVTEACGGQFLYVTLPNQYASFAAEYPAWLNNRAEYTALACGSLFLALDERDVDWLDLGQLLLQPDTRSRTALRTDNHFNMFGAYLTYRTVLRHINATRAEPLKILEPGEYTLRKLPNPFLGSRSRKLFALDGLTEQLSILTPIEPVPFRRWGNGALLAAEVYALPASEDEPVDYNTLYMGGDYAETVIQTGREELPSVLIYGDSFTNAVECLLYYSFGRMHSLDLRYFREQSLGAYIEAYRPDYVICLRDYEQSASPWGNGGPAFPTGEEELLEQTW